MSGLLSALQLRRAGWAVDIYERLGTELSGRGAGIVAQQELIARLRGLGLATEGLGVEVSPSARFSIAHGRLTEEIECPQVLTAWERVYRLLRDAFPPEHYFRGRGLSKVTQTADKVTAHFSDGETIDADLLVGADGIRSTVRQQFAARRRAALCRLYAHGGRCCPKRHSARCARRSGRGHVVRSAAGRTISRLSGGRPGQRSAARSSPLQHHLVSPRR